MTVDILYFEGCPHSEVARDRVREAFASERVAGGVRMVEVSDAQDALARHFLGSPTIQIDGVDVEPEARLRRDYGFMCRTYETPAGLAGVPPLQLVADAIRERLSTALPCA